VLNEKRGPTTVREQVLLDATSYSIELPLTPGTDNKFAVTALTLGITPPIESAETRVPTITQSTEGYVTEEKKQRTK
jgi:hypothetical protein